MSDSNIIYADGITNVSLNGGVIRVEWYAVTGSPPVEGEAPNREIVQTMIMSPQGFLETLGSFNNLLQQMDKAGMLRRVEAAAADESNVAKDDGAKSDK